MLLAVPKAVLCLNEVRSESAGKSHLYTAPRYSKGSLVTFNVRSITSTGLSFRGELCLWDLTAYSLLHTNLSYVFFGSQGLADYQGWSFTYFEVSLMGS